MNESPSDIQEIYFLGLTLIIGSHLVTFGVLKHSVVSSVSFKIKNKLYKYPIHLPADEVDDQKKCNHHLYHGCVEQIMGLVVTNMI